MRKSLRRRTRPANKEDRIIEDAARDLAKKWQELYGPLIGREVPQATIDKATRLFRAYRDNRIALAAGAFGYAGLPEDRLIPAAETILAKAASACHAWIGSTEFPLEEESK